MPSSRSLSGPASAPSEDSSRALAEAGGRALYELSAGSLVGGDLTVVSFTGREEISQVFSFAILVLAPRDADLLETPLLGQAATFLIQVPGGMPRVVHGVIAAVRPEGASTHDGRRLYRLRLVPRLWLLKHRVTSRIFQDRTVPQIISSVLEDNKTLHRWALSRSYPVRTYCVQYQESDLAFVQRLLAEEGIFYSFEHLSGAHNEPLASAAPGVPGATERIVFADSAAAYPAMAALSGERAEGTVLYLREGQGMSTADDEIYRFSLDRQVRSGAVLLRDYDFRRPLFEMRSEAQITPAASPANPSPPLLSRSASAGAEERVQAGLGIYVHRSEYEEPPVTEARAHVVLEQQRRKVIHGEGASRCRRILPGVRFQLEAESAMHLAREYVITRVKHEGSTPELTHVTAAGPGERPKVYANRFGCVPADIAYRPKRPKRMLQQVAESATVVGPAGEEIFTDQYGRIKVQFHWDLEGKRNEHSSCWIRVSQAWAGSTFGFQFLPRVGMEVLVTFLGGDVDQPVVTGCLFNAINAPSQLLPIKATRSGIRTRSTPGGGGFNELIFDDKAGEEQVLLRAQRRFDEVIGGDHSISIGGEESVKAAGSRKEEIEGDVALRVGGQRSEELAGDHSEQIGGDFDRAVLGEQRTSVGGDASIEVGGSRTLLVRGNHHVIVGHGSDSGHALLYANGDYTVGVSQELKLSAKRAIKLSVGDSSIEITADGIKLKAKSISVEGTDGAAMKVKGHELKMDEKLELVSDTIELFSSKGSIVMDEDVHIDGKLVKLNCKPKAPDPAKELEALPEEGIATFRVKRKVDGTVPSGVTLIIGTPSGEVIEKEADAEGKVEIKGKKGERFILIGVRERDHVFGHQKS